MGLPLSITRNPHRRLIPSTIKLTFALVKFDILQINPSPEKCTNACFGVLSKMSLDNSGEIFEKKISIGTPFLSAKGI
jgi:hypothetical protein